MGKHHQRAGNKKRTRLDWLEARVGELEARSACIVPRLTILDERTCALMDTLHSHLFTHGDLDAVEEEARRRAGGQEKLPEGRAAPPLPGDGGGSGGGGGLGGGGGAGLKDESGGGGLGGGGVRYRICFRVDGHDLLVIDHQEEAAAAAPAPKPEPPPSPHTGEEEEPGA